MKLFTLLVIASLITTSIAAQPGSLDASFGTNGKAFYTDFGSANAMALQADGKILVGGTKFSDTIRDFTVTRFMPDGTVDASFGNNGTARTHFISSEIFSLSVLKDGKILASGYGGLQFLSYFSPILVQYLPNGTVDSTFGINGVASVDADMLGTWVYALAMQVAVDGSIVQAGYSQKDVFSSPKAIIIRYKPDGTLDTSFGTNGTEQTQLTGYINSLALQPNGKIIIAGSTFGEASNSNLLIARLDNNGEYDDSFGINGIRNIDIDQNADEIHALTLQPDGKILAAGYFDLDGFYHHTMMLARFKTDGFFDSSFGEKNGISFCFFDNAHAVGNSIIFQDDGKINVGGYTMPVTDEVSGEFGLAQFNADGSLNTSFGDNGKIITAFKNHSMRINGLALQPDGKIVAVGIAYALDTDKPYYNLAMARYNNEGVLAEPLQHFTAAVTPNGSIALNWQAANENNLSYYKIQRSSNAHFNNGISQLTQIAAGHAVNNSYVYTDNAPLQGTNYYRIAQVSNDGVSNYSNIVSASINSNVSISIFPNPVRDVVNIKGLNTTFNYQLSIVNSKGNVVAKTSITNVNAYNWNVQQLAKGVYYVRLASTNGKIVTLKFVKE